MSAAKATAQAARPGPPPPPAEAGWEQTAWSVGKAVLMFFAVQAVTRYGPQLLGYGPPAKAVAPTTPAVNVPTTPGTTPAAPGPAVPLIAEPIWPLGTPISMYLYSSVSPDGDDIELDAPLIKWDGLTYGNYKDEREVDLVIDVPHSVRTGNGSWWMNIKLVKNGGSAVGRPATEVASYRKELTRWYPKRKVRKEKKLIGGEDEEETILEEAPVAQQIVSHWSRNLTLTIVSNGGQQNMAALPPTAAPHYLLAPSAEGTKLYYPPVFPNDFWLLRENMLPINETSYTLPLRITYQAIGTMKFNMFSAMTQSFEQAAASQGTGSEMDEVKRMLTETSPWLLVTTALVTVLHMLFEFLAFSSDIGHWRKKDKDLVGVSLNTILTNCFVQLVILLYLQDSSEETSFMILFGQGIGLLIEAWKITKVVNIRIRPAQGLIPYQVTFEDKKVLSDDEKKTQEYDRLAFRLVSYAAIPLLMGYTVYSLLYMTHRGWYSFIVTTLAQAIYAFGFVQLIPQLIINYKLKSVAHMPMKAMVYKTLSTVVDDFFAFCIKMPWLHRLACFRDDVVFLILIYQRWIYRVDPTRVNEYGQVVEGKVEPVGEESKKDK